MNFSRKKPRAATATPPSSAATHRFGTTFRMATPKYAPSMNSAPCVRFAILINPKMSEKPDASRNSSPPNARLFSVWMTQNCNFLFQVLRGREIPRIDRVLEKLLGFVGPELADVRVGVDHAVHQAPFLALDLADVHVADHVAVLVEGDRPANGVGFRRPQGLHERVLVLDIALDRAERRFQHCAFDVGRRGVEARV